MNRCVKEHVHGTTSIALCHLKVNVLYKRNLKLVLFYMYKGGMNYWFPYFDTIFVHSYLCSNFGQADSRHYRSPEYMYHSPNTNLARCVIYAFIKFYSGGETLWYYNDDHLSAWNLKKRTIKTIILENNFKIIRQCMT